MADEFCLKMPDFHVTFRDILRHGTNGFTSLPKEGVLRIFFALKNPTASTGFETANLGTKGQHATSRPPKPQNTFISVLYSNHWDCKCQDTGQFTAVTEQCDPQSTARHWNTLCKSSNMKIYTALGFKETEVLWLYCRIRQLYKLRFRTNRFSSHTVFNMRLLVR